MNVRMHKTLAVMLLGAAFTTVVACDSSDTPDQTGNTAGAELSDPSAAPGDAVAETGTPDAAPSAPEDTADHVVKMSVDYAGSKTGNLVVGLFTSFPPTGPPAVSYTHLRAHET